MARSRGPQGNVLWGDGSRAPDVLLCGDAAHNAAAHVPGLGVVLLGGRSSQKDVRRRLAGTCPENMERDRRKSGVRAYRLAKGNATPLFGGRSIIDGSGRVPGCVEGRSRGMWCEFDGRLSATVFRGRVHLFARANVRMGIRAVQHTSVDVKAFSNGKLPLPWSRWEPVEFASYSFSQSHVYFACVDAFEDTLVALAPVSFPERREAGIYAAFSIDGRAWSPWSKSGTAPSRASARSTTRPVDYWSRRTTLYCTCSARSAASATTSIRRCHHKTRRSRAWPCRKMSSRPGSSSAGDDRRPARAP